ncbi:uncharacterized protein PADG_12405 [Paracoccidioides brasiliensis Pb18]|uniref:HTH psq-type domain-containing protein n=1 Tax=Paracoccidioides brasiliensis (strain Pb18) TaxID=502780 RepID=A0A0A0HT55_PARBD|nr:uncharacterized protein PADG_12405 [Paracoccidioides brasiliensis Pb18]KGM91493.1 hypothetical protein PADG_12405 [Paracoccidioides brasiliensis Pb18]
MPNEEAIQLAIKDLRAQKVKNYAATARKHSINKETLCQHYNSLQLMQDETASLHKKQLSNQQEQTLLLYIEKLAAHSFAPTPQIIQNLIAEIIKESIADNSTHFEHYFQLLNEKIEKYNIESSNICNFDKKSFLISIGQVTKQIISVEALKTK